MLKNIHIQNFQSHEDTTIDLAAGTVAITGSNNHGKSVIFRALHKVFRDFPEGNVFVSWWSDSCKITVVTDTGKVLRQVKKDNSNDANLYKINDTDEYVKFGRTGIPIEILQTLETSEIQKFGDFKIDMNFQSQFDDLFMITGDGLASMRGKVLGRITGVDTIQRAVQKVILKEKNTQQEIKKAQLRLIELGKFLEDYDNVDMLISLKNNINFFIVEFKEKNIQKEACEKGIKTLTETVEKAKIYNQKLLWLSRDVDTLYKELKEKLNCVNVCKQIININNYIIKQRDIEKKTDIINVEQIIPTLKEKLIIFHLLNTLHIIENKKIIFDKKININIPSVEIIKDKLEKCNTYKNTKNWLDVQQQMIFNSNVVADNKVKELAEQEIQLSKIKTILKICPTCGEPFKGN